MAGEHENRTHLSRPKPGNSGFEVRDGHQLRNLSHYNVIGNCRTASIMEHAVRIILEAALIGNCNLFYLLILGQVHIEYVKT